MTPPRKHTLDLEDGQRVRSKREHVLGSIEAVSPSRLRAIEVRGANEDLIGP